MKRTNEKLKSHVYTDRTIKINADAHSEKRKSISGSEPQKKDRV